MLRILLVNDRDSPLGALRTALVQGGHEILAELSSATVTPHTVASMHPDVVMIDTGSPGRGVLEGMPTLTRIAPTDDGMMAPLPAVHVLEQPGMSAYAAAGVDAMGLESVLAASAAVMQDAGQDDDRLIGRALALLMQLRHFSEADAREALRRMARDRQISLRQVAEKLLSMNDLLA